MAVVINDFEILVEPTPGAVSGPQVQQEGPAPLPPRPEDIERVVCHFAERRRRLLAD